MGFFGKVFKSVGRAIGRGVEKFGEWTGSEKLKNIGRGIQSACSETSRKTGSTREYDRETASESQTASVAEILSGFSMGLKGQASSIELQAKYSVESYMDDLIKAMEAVFGKCSATRGLERQKKLIVGNIDNSLTNVLAQRVSLTDQECLDILKMSSGSQKEAAMNAFGKKVINEGLDSLCKRLEKAFDDVCESINSELNELAAQQNRDYESLIEQLNKIAVDRKNDTDNQEMAMLQPAQKLAASEIVADLIRSGDVA